MKKMSYQTLVLLFLALMYSGIVPAAQSPDLKQQEERWCFLFANSPLMALPMARVIELSAVTLETNFDAEQN